MERDEKECVREERGERVEWVKRVQVEGGNPIVSLSLSLNQGRPTHQPDLHWATKSIRASL